jgi:hypothetical protein
MLVPDRSWPKGSPVCDYWLSRCEGFTVRAGGRTLGVVETVTYSAPARRTETIVLRKRGRRRLLAADHVLAIVPARELILVRRRQHAGPALRRSLALTMRAAVILRRATGKAIAVASPVVAALARRAAAAAWAFSRRLARAAAAEIRDRNARHGPEPGDGDAHRVANVYDYALR